MAYRRAGLLTGAPWLVLHGGPGSGSQPGSLQPFNLKKQQVIVPDQRGAGLSRPRAWTVGNHTEQLVADLERLRQQLGIERWSVLAGSWGTVLALSYAQRHPQRVERLVLRGSFALRSAEIDGLLHPHPIRARTVFCNRHWPRAPRSGKARILARLEQLLQFGTPTVATLHAVRCWNLLEQGAALWGMKRSLVSAVMSPEHHLLPAMRRTWAQLKRQQRRATANLNRPGISRDDRRGWQKFRIQSHYLRHRGFVRPGDLDRAVQSLAKNGIPSDWVHGKFDAVCPVSNSQRWIEQTQHQQAGLAHGHWPTAGHLSSEPGMRAALEQMVLGTQAALR